MTTTFKSDVDDLFQALLEKIDKLKGLEKYEDCVFGISVCLHDKKPSFALTQYKGCEDSKYVILSADTYHGFVLNINEFVEKEIKDVREKELCEELHDKLVSHAHNVAPTSLSPLKVTWTELYLLLDILKQRL